MSSILPFTYKNMKAYASLGKSIIDKSKEINECTIVEKQGGYDNSFDNTHIQVYKVKETNFIKLDGCTVATNTIVVITTN